jgi:hypothetical protein
MTQRQATLSTESRYEYGLRLPDGKELWPPVDFYGTGYQTENERALVLQAIKDALRNMSLPEVATLDSYKWLVREYETITIETVKDFTFHDLDEPGLVEEEEEERVDAEEESGGMPFNQT